MDNGRNTDAYDSHVLDIAKRVAEMQAGGSSGDRPPLGLSRGDWGKIIVGWFAALAVFAFVWYSTVNLAIQERPTRSEVDEMVDKSERKYDKIDESQREIRESLARMESKLEALSDVVKGMRR